MPSIKIAGHEVSVDDQDVHFLSDFHWNVRASGRTSYVQKALFSDGQYVGYRSLHRLIMGCPDDMVVDHINGDGLDNRRANLRICTAAQNTRNRKVNRNSASGFKGVELSTAPRTNNPWRARITVDGRRISLGSYPTPEEAYAAYCRAAKKMHGEFARIA